MDPEPCPYTYYYAFLRGIELEDCDECSAGILCNETGIGDT
jgi:hypothetical protein